jgi:hypothetical protein
LYNNPVTPIIIFEENIMSPNKKVLFTLLTFVVAMVLIACSCSSIIPLVTTPQSSQEAMPGLAGKWLDADTGDNTVIAWQNNTYVVTSISWKTTTYPVTSQSWSGGTLTWTYKDTDLNLTVTRGTVSVSGNNLDTTWAYSDGTSGTVTLTRVTP